jgi:hypothetical protein
MARPKPKMLQVTETETGAEKNTGAELAQAENKTHNE